VTLTARFSEAYYRALVGAYRSAGTSALIDELDRTVTELERVTKRG
jgi:hypothetical protein